MRSAFDITAASQEVQLRDRRGEVTFTVTNTTETPVLAYARVDPDPGAHPEWFTIVGEAERRFAARGLHQYTVQIDVPATAEARRYLFRLLQIGSDNPDDYYTEGPTVAFVAPARAPIEPEQEPAWWIPFVIVVLLLALLFRRQDAVLVVLLVACVGALFVPRLRSRGWTPPRLPSLSLPRGRGWLWGLAALAVVAALVVLFAVSPLAGFVVLGLGLVVGGVLLARRLMAGRAMPDVTNKKGVFIVLALVALLYAVGVGVRAGSGAGFEVVGEAGDSAVVDALQRLLVPAATMPNVRNLPLDAARQRLASEFSSVCGSVPFDRCVDLRPTLPFGFVVAQDPPPGERVPAGLDVEIGADGRTVEVRPRIVLFMQ